MKAHPLPVSEEHWAGLGGVIVSNSLPSKSREDWAESCLSLVTLCGVRRSHRWSQQPPSPAQSRFTAISDQRTKAITPSPTCPWMLPRPWTYTLNVSVVSWVVETCPKDPQPGPPLGYGRERTGPSLSLITFIPTSVWSGHGHLSSSSVPCAATSSCLV